MRRDPQRELEQLRRYRNRGGADLSISKAVESLTRQVVRQAGACAGLDSAWAEVVPAGLVGLTQVIRLSPGGVLTVRATDAAAAYELDQWVRGGGLAVLRQACRRTLRRVKVVS
jgi:hypothetical protein